MYDLDNVVENDEEEYSPLSEGEILGRMYSFLGDPGVMEKAEFLDDLLESDKAVNALWNLIRYYIRQDPNSLFLREFVEEAERIIRDKIEEGEI